MAVTGRMKKWSGWSQSQMLAAMLAVRCLQPVSNCFPSRTGQDLLYSLMAYRHLVAALCVAPLAFFLERENSKKMEWSTWLWLFINALTGITAAMGLFYCGLRDTTATYSSNFLNIIPIVTFLGLGSKGGKIKTAGAILCFHLADAHHFHRPAVMEVSKSQWTRGTFMLVGSCVCYASEVAQSFPMENRATLLTCIIASIQSAVIGLCLNRSKAAWRLEWNLQLITIVYSGALSTAATFCLLTWSIAKRGPTYAPMFNPLALVFVAISEALVLGEQIRLGMKELKCLPLSNEGVDEMATAVPESVELKSLAPV
ncbi:hypothetical protein V6Z11_1Z007900 [Gossypium hirsutum]